MLPGPPAQPPSVQGRTTTAPQRLEPGSPGPWAAESEPRTGWPRSAPGAVAAGGPRVAGWAGFPPRADAPVGVVREVLRGAVGVLDRRRRRLTQVSEGPPRDLGQPSPPVHPAGGQRADPRRKHPGIAQMNVGGAVLPSKQAAVALGQTRYRNDQRQVGGNPTPAPSVRPALLLDPGRVEPHVQHDQRLRRPLAIGGNTRCIA